MRPPKIPCPRNNPHCQGVIDDLPIDNVLFMMAVVIIIMAYLLLTKKKYKQL